MGTYEIRTLQHTGTTITIFGDKHTGDALPTSADALDWLMDDHDTFSWEALGYDPDTAFNAFDQWIYRRLTGFSVAVDDLAADGFSAYTEAVNDLAADHYDEAWGPDSFHSTPYALGLAAPAILLANAGYDTQRLVRRDEFSERVRTELRAMYDDLVGNDTDVELDLDPDVSRRQVLGYAAIPLTLGWFGGSVDSAVEMTGRDADLYGMYTDIRDVFTAEGLAYIAGDTDADRILHVCGKDHMDDIAAYLEDDAERGTRLDQYGAVMDTVLESDTRMAHLVNIDGAWWRQDTVDLYP